ncbi:MAG: hypothetical protein ABR574_04315 [Cryomorphaceae bacterium]|nr:presenilin [Flavobacteriales bacterium]
MFEKINLEEELRKAGSEEKRNQTKTLLGFKALFQTDWEREQEISQVLSRGAVSEALLSPEKLDEQNIFELDDIKKLCINYRLRFLSTKHFKSDFPREAMTEIKNVENRSGEKISAFMIMAPSTMFKLEDANKDPLLFTPLSDGRFYLIHKWGGDLSPFRKILAWPFKNLVNLVSTIFFISFFLASIIPIDMLSSNNDFFSFYRAAFAAWNVIFLSGMVSFFWFALHQKFSVSAWNDSTFN